jgi:hypothetical protein
LLLGGGVFVAAGVAAVRVWRRRASTGATGAEPSDVFATAPGGEWVAMPPGTVPSVDRSDVASALVVAPPISPSEQVVPHARDAEDVVERLVPPEMHPPRTDRRVDLLIAVLVIAAAVAVVFAIVRLG